MDIDNRERNTDRMNLMLKLRIERAIGNAMTNRSKKKKKNRGQRVKTIDDPCRLISFTFTDLGSPRGYRSLVPLNIGRIDGLAAV